MVKVTRKIMQGANLRQAIRPNISKKVNLRQPLAKNNSNPHININKFFLNQGFRQINSTNVNSTSQDHTIKHTPNFLQCNIQNIITQDESPANKDRFNEDKQENHSQEHNNINDNDSFDQDDNISDDDQENYYDQENYLNQENYSDQEE